MERVHYRRHTPSKLRQDGEEPKKYDSPIVEVEGNGFVEKFVMQGIISGIILAVVLVINLVDNSMTAGIRNSLNTAISEHITAEQVATEVRRFLGEPEPYRAAYLEYDITVPSYNLTTDPIVNPNIELSPGTNPRIDEDLLREILGYTDSNDLQSTAPESMIPPEL